ncbi:Rv3654c family TadE-like protein [Nocardia sp. NPDC059180]|uniref:Rv3654c family TadE-like protein n=1 Tax=Nocardia sp. NPDC059180 TaxID=3346761 RepID=UPI0036B2AB66
MIGLALVAESCPGAVGQRRVRGEIGGATVFAALALAGLLGLTVLVGQVGAGVVARHRAQATADLAALAAAGALVYGAAEACAEGGEIARRMRMTIRMCEVVEWDVLVTVEGKIPIGLLGDRTVRAMARAGPVEEEA